VNSYEAIAAAEKIAERIAKHRRRWEEHVSGDQWITFQIGELEALTNFVLGPVRREGDAARLGNELFYGLAQRGLLNLSVAELVRRIPAPKPKRKENT
jgi:hypothetical protein